MLLQTLNLGIRTQRIESKRWNKIFHLNSNQKRLGCLYDYQINFKSKKVMRDKEGYYIIDKMLITSRTDNNNKHIHLTKVFMD